ncbi:hypothetical protein PoB_004178200, partial [Plakobranchus ocellatus]
MLWSTLVFTCADKASGALPPQGKCQDLSLLVSFGSALMVERTATSSPYSFQPEFALNCTTLMP